MKSDRLTPTIYLVAGAAFALAAIPVFLQNPTADPAGFLPAATGPGSGAVVVGPASSGQPPRSIDRRPHAPGPDAERPTPPALSVDVPPDLQGAVTDLSSGDQDDPNRSTRLREIARAWSESDPVSGILWSVGLDSGDCHLALREILRHDRRMPDEFARQAFEKLAATEGGSRRNRHLAESFLLEAWATIDPASAWERVSGSEEPAHLESVLTTWSESDPESVAAELSELAEAEPGVLRSLSPVYALTARGLADADPAQAVPWVSEIPDEKSRATATAALMNRWIRRDPQAASTWLDGLPEGPAKDAGIASLVLAVRHEDPEAARHWTETLSENSERLRRNLLAFWEPVD